MKIEFVDILIYIILAICLMLAHFTVFGKFGIVFWNLYFVVGLFLLIESKKEKKK